MLKLILKIIGLIVLAMVALVLLVWLFRVVSFIISLVMGLLLLAGLVYLVSFLFKISVKTDQTTPQSYKVCDRSQPAVALFMKQPTVRELVNAQQMSHITEWALNGSVLEIDNDTQVIVLDDSKEKEAVRIRVANGQFHGREGWVCRSVLLHSEDKLLRG